MNKSAEKETTVRVDGKNGEKEVFIRTEAGVKSVCARVDDVNWLSFVSFAWMFSWMWRSYKDTVPTDPNQSALWECSIFDSSNVNMARLEHLWNEEKHKASSAQPPRRPSLFRTVLRFISKRLSNTCLVFLFCIVFGFIGPTCLVRGLLAFTENPKKDDSGVPLYSHGLVFALSILFVEILRVLTYGATWAISYRTAIRTRGAVLALLYKHLMNAKSLRGKSSAEIVNIFANDGQRIFDACTFAPLVLVGPFVLIGGLIYLLGVIGPLSLLGVAVFFVFDVIQAILGISMVKCRNWAIAETEKRMTLVGEIIRCIKCIKLNGWEELFYARVRTVREREKRYLRIAGYAQSLAVASGAIVPVVATIVMIIAIVLNGSDLRASDAFSAITVFFVMLFGIRMIPYGIRYLAEARQALGKIEAFLLFDLYEMDHCAPAAHSRAIELQHSTFSWDQQPKEVKQEKPVEKNCTNGKSSLAEAKMANGEETVALNGPGQKEDQENATQNEPNADARSPICLRDVTLSIEKGELVGLCGVIGSGKSALLNAITGHMVENDGQLSVSGSVALCPQQPSILASTVRENILFGQPMNSQRYYRAITAAQLSKDLEQFPENEQSKISSCKLSGGQRARISIARALYANRDIYLFDDIFSSVDKPVAAKIFSSGIKELLANKTRILVSNDPEYLTECDRVIFLEQGRVLETGRHSELLTSSDAYCAFFASYQAQQSDGTVSPDSARSVLSTLKQQSEDKRGQEVEGPVEEIEEDYGSRAVGKDVYLEFINAGGGCFLCTLVIASFVLNVGANVFATLWLSKWMRDAHNNGTAQVDGQSQGSLADSPSSYIIVYACTLLVLFLSGMIKAILFVKFTLTAATQLHNRMLRRVLHATAAFFHQTPAGRILNRFSKDMDEIDVKLPFSAEALLQGMITCIGFLLVIVWVFPLFLIPSVPIFCLFMFFFLCFRAGIRSLKRIENVTRSPVFDHLSTSLDSIQTIHAFGQTQKFIDHLKKKLDENSGALFLYHSAMRWQAVWLDLLVVLITFCVSMFILLLTGHIEPSDAGMAIAFAMQMSGIFQFAVRSQTELEAKMTSVERVSDYYKNIEFEPEQADPNNLPAEWPRKGSVQFDDVILRYASQISPALNNVAFTVEEGKKIGIVGRTGSGKTSLCNALFRLYPLESGRILVDQWDISALNLQRLRRSMAIISQEPTLFAGTLRFNIDPEGSCEDAKIWECLNRIGLGESVNLFAEKLDFKVETGGKNLSAGQRQLVCMVRAMLRNTKIVVLDEATANVDIQTDSLLQSAIQEMFADRTVIVITHRLANLDNVDTVLEMADGRLKTREGSANRNRVSVEPENAALESSENNNSESKNAAECETEQNEEEEEKDPKHHLHTGEENGDISAPLKPTEVERSE